MTSLILHKVRGEPAFDVAEYLDEVKMWIIPTSGHRAYPYKMWPLEDLEYCGSWADLDLPNSKYIPDDWPDHYPLNEPKPNTIPLKAKPGPRKLPSLDEVD